VTYGRDDWWRAAAGLGVLAGLVATVAFAADSALVAEGKRTAVPGGPGDESWLADPGRRRQVTPGDT
jgi:hypothetical protein